MFVILLGDFAKLYRATRPEANITEKRLAQEFMERNPSCPQIKTADTFQEALKINVTFDIR